MKHLRLFLALFTLLIGGASASAQGWTGSEVQQGEFYLYNVAAKQFLNNGSMYGTRAIRDYMGIPITVSANGDGTWNLLTKVDDKSVGYDGALFYTDMSGDMTKATFEPVEGKTNVYNIKFTNGTDTRYIAYNQNYKYWDRGMYASGEAYQWMLISKDERDAASSISSTVAKKDFPVDVTYKYFQNPNFTGKFPTGFGLDTWEGDGWTINGNTQWYADPFDQNAEHYDKKFDTYKLLSNIPAGKYRFYVTGFYRDCGNGGGASVEREVAGGSESIHNALIYANDQTTELQTIGVGRSTVLDGFSTTVNEIEYRVPNTQSQAVAFFWNDQYPEQYVDAFVSSEGILKIGIKKDVRIGADWTLIDKFHLAYLGPTIEAVATELPADGTMEANKWYFINIEIDGIYNITTSSLTDIVYTQDGTTLIEDQNDVTTQFAGTVNQSLTTGRYYIKSSSEQSFAIEFFSYEYYLGEEVLSVADGGYTQNATYTVTFPNAVTSDPNCALALMDGSKATVNGNEVSLSSVDNGFSLDLGTLTANTDYVISIPADVYGYSEHNMNEAINITIHTPTVFDGEYVLYDASNKLFFGRGNQWGTEASVDKYGIPFNLVTNAEGASSIEFVDWPGVYLFITGTAIYTDNASTGWKLVPTDGGYYLRDAQQTIYATHSTGSFGEYVHITTVEASATVWTLKTKAERDAIIATYPSENISNVITASGISTTTDTFKDFLSTNFNDEDYTDRIGTATFEDAAGAWTWTGTSRTQNGQPAYGNNFVEAWNATGAWTQTISKENLPAGIYKVTVQGYERRKDNNASTALYNAGYNLVSAFLSANDEQVRFTDWNDVDGKPTNTAGAVTAFTNGEAVNEVYVYLDGNTDLSLMVRKPNYIWDCWVILNNFKLTRYTEKTVTITIKSSFTGTTYSSENALDFTNSGLTAYIITGAEDGKCLSTPVTKVPAGTGVYVEREEAAEEAADYTVNIYAGSDYSDVVGNLLIGTGAQSKELLSNSSVTYYIFGMQSGKESFFKVSEDPNKKVQASAHKAYLAIPTSPSNAKALVIVRPNDDMVSEDGGFADGINNVEQDDINAKIYNLNGQRVNNAQKGIYIKNGKKVIIK